MSSSQSHQLTKAHLLSNHQMVFQASKLAEGMQELASLADGPVLASGNTLTFTIDGAPRTLEVRVSC